MRIINHENEFIEILKDESNYTGTAVASFLTLEDLIIDTSLRITSFSNPNLTVTIGKNCCFNYHVCFEECNFKRFNINSYKVIFKSDLSFLECEIETTIFVNGCTLNSTLNFDNLNVEEIKIENSRIKTKITINEIRNIEVLSFSGVVSKELEISNIPDEAKLIIESNHNNLTEINKVNLNTNCNTKIGTNGFKCEFGSVKFSGGIPRNSDMYLSNLNLKELIFENFYNLGYSNILSLNKKKNYADEKYFKIINSDLGYFNIYDSDLSDFKLFFKGSKLNNLYITSTQFIEPKKINGTESNQDSEKYSHRDKIDVYSQLKKVFENSGNFLKSTKFHRYELELREKGLESHNYEELKNIYSQFKKMYEQRGDSVKSLEYQAKEMEIHMKSPGISWSERLNLQFAYWSNNFGTDWIKAIKFLIIGAAYFYFLVILSQNCEFENSWNTVWGLLSGFFEFLNPIRKLNSLTINGNEEILNNKARIADFFARIFIAFAEYQLIQAFRKYGKK